MSKLVEALGLTVQDERRLRRAAGFAGGRGLEREIAGLVDVLASGQRHDEFTNFLLREDVTRISTAWSEFVQAVAWVRRYELEPARDQFERLLDRGDLTPALRTCAGSYLAQTYQMLGQLNRANDMLTRLRSDTTLKTLIDHLPAAQAGMLSASVIAQQGDIAVREGLYAAARQLYEDAHRLYLQVKASLPSKWSWVAQIGLGLARLRLAKVAIFQRAEEEALSHCARSNEHWDKAAPEHTTTPLLHQTEGRLRVKEFEAWAYTRQNRLGHDRFNWAQTMRAEVWQEAVANGLKDVQMKNQLYTGDDLRNRIEDRIETQRKLPNFHQVSPGIALNAMRDAEVKQWIVGAERAYTEAIRLCGGSGGWRDPLIYGLCLRNMAVIKRFQGKGQYAEAEALLSQAEQYESDLQQRSRLPSIYEAWGDLNWDQGQLDWARQRYEQALRELDALVEPAGIQHDWQSRQRERIRQSLDGIASQSQPLPPTEDDQPTRVWIEWRQATRTLVHLLDGALWQHGAVPVATQDMDEKWVRELEAFEALADPRILAQGALSMSLAPDLPVRDEFVKRCHKSRHDILIANVMSWPTNAPFPAAHDVCCRPTVEGAMALTSQRGCARGAAYLLDAAPASYLLEASLFPLPLGFAAKGERVLVELPLQTIRRYQMRIERFLSTNGTVGLNCFRLDDPSLAEELRAVFASLVALARRSTLSTVSTERHEESPRAWLTGILDQWEPPNPAI